MDLVTPPFTKVLKEAKKRYVLVTDDGSDFESPKTVYETIVSIFSGEK